MIKAIIRGESPIVSVIGIGVGKSLLFILLAMCSAQDHGSSMGDIMIVVILIISLQQDIQRRCQAVKLLYTEWDYYYPQSRVFIMLVTSKSVIS